MALIDFDKFLASFITEIKKNHTVITYNIPSCIKKALEEQGLEYKEGEIVKTQRRVSAEAKEAGYDESEGEIIRKHLIDCVTRTIPEADAFKEISKEQILDWLEKQGQKSAWTEADDEELENTINALKGAGKHDNFDWLSTVKWLLTIKQRIGGYLSCLHNDNKECRYCHSVTAQGGWRFKGCFCPPLKGMSIVEVKVCPKAKGE